MSAAQRSAMERIGCAVHRLAAVVDDLLLLGGERSARTAAAASGRQADIVEVAHEVAATWRPSCERRGIDLTLKQHPTLSVAVDRRPRRSPTPPVTTGPRSTAYVTTRSPTPTCVTAETSGCCRCPRARGSWCTSP